MYPNSRRLVITFYKEISNRRSSNFVHMPLYFKLGIKSLWSVPFTCPQAKR